MNRFSEFLRLIERSRCLQTCSYSGKEQKRLLRVMCIGLWYRAITLYPDITIDDINKTSYVPLNHSHCGRGPESFCYVLDHVLKDGTRWWDSFKDWEAIYDEIRAQGTASS